MKKSESKYFNTAVLMNKALILLLEKKDLQFITVKEICQKAGVNRSTFYLHYENISDLLEETNEYINREFLASFHNSHKEFVQKIKHAPLEELVIINKEFLEPYLTFVKENKYIFKAAFKNPHCLETNKRKKMIIEHIFFPIMDRFSIPKEKQRYWATYYINGTMAIIREWLENGCREEIEEIEKILIECTLPQDVITEKKIRGVS